MATHDVDQKLLGRLAEYMFASNPTVADALYKIVGISVQLTARLVRGRKARRSGSARDTKTIDLYHHIVYLTRSGLEELQDYVLEYSQAREASAELKIFALKLRVSFYHIICLFHNYPPISIGSSSASPKLPPGQTSPRQGNGQRRRTPPQPSSSKRTSSDSKGNQASSPTASRIRGGTFREQIPSMASETSYVTNPYAAISPPPGLNPLVPVANPANFLMPAMNYVPITKAAFENVSVMAARLLPASSPLRLSVELEHCAFLWDCLHDHDGCRRLARRVIREVYRSTEGMNDEEFDDAAVLVGTLGRMMRRKDHDGSPRFAEMTPPPRWGSSLGRSSTPSRYQSSRS